MGRESREAGQSLWLILCPRRGGERAGELHWEMMLTNKKAVRPLCEQEAEFGGRTAWRRCHPREGRGLSRDSGHCRSLSQGKGRMVHYTIHPSKAHVGAHTNMYTHTHITVHGDDNQADKVRELWLKPTQGVKRGPRLENTHLSCKARAGALCTATVLRTGHSPGQVQVDVNAVFSRDPEKVSLC